MVDESVDEGAVIDASALAAVIFGEPGGHTIARKISRRAWSVSTSLLEYEIRNVGLVKARRGEFTFEEAERSLRRAVFPPTRSFDTRAASRLARHHELTYYDAAYLQLAVELGASLFTLDARLLKADPARCVDPSVE